MKCLGYSIEIAENSDIQIMKIFIYIIAKEEIPTKRYKL